MIRLLHKIDVQPGGFLMMSLLVFFSDLPVLFAIVGNVLIHEWGHIYMLRKCGVYVRGVYVSFTGLCIRCNLDGQTRRASFLCAAAGPAVGVCAALFTSVCGNVLGNDFLLLFAGTGLILSVFNLLPVKPLDGWRMLRAVFPEAAEIVGNLCAIAVLSFGLYVMAAGYGTTLACLGIFFLLQEQVERLGFL